MEKNSVQILQKNNLCTVFFKKITAYVFGTMQKKKVNNDIL